MIYREPEKARPAFALEAEYTRVFAEQVDEAFAFGISDRNCRAASAP